MLDKGHPMEYSSQNDWVHLLVGMSVNVSDISLWYWKYSRRRIKIPLHKKEIQTSEAHNSKTKCSRTKFTDLRIYVHFKIETED